MMTKELTDTQKQKLGLRVVDREIFHCASQFISAMYEMEEHPDELFDAFTKYDYDECSRYHIYENMEDEEVIGELNELDVHDYHIDDCKTTLYNHLLDIDGFDDFCHEQGLDPDPVDIFEHWIVSDWLADLLEGRGEAVLRDFMGFTIWGRACTGQSINLDHVIQSIGIQYFDWANDPV